jgi:ligand-binding SRPBCC domain-containing protein
MSRQYRAVRIHGVFGHHILSREQRLPDPPAAVFPFFGEPENLEAITPPWLRFRIVAAPDELGVGSLIEYRLRLHGVPVAWLTRIEEWVPGERFVDAQLHGPYALWHHTHEFLADGDGGTLMRDTVRYALPFGPLGEVAHRLFVARDLERIFDYRREQLTRR